MITYPELFGVADNNLYCLNELSNLHFHYGKHLPKTQGKNDENHAVTQTPAAAGEPKGHWFRREARTSSAIMLYFHGGGYALYTAATARMIETIAAAACTPAFVPDYPSDPRKFSSRTDRGRRGSLSLFASKGVRSSPDRRSRRFRRGHLALMTLLALRKPQLLQPALAICLCPWSDIGDRGKSLFGNELRSGARLSSSEIRRVVTGRRRSDARAAFAGISGPSGACAHLSAGRRQGNSDRHDSGFRSYSPEAECERHARCMAYDDP